MTLGGTIKPVVIDSFWYRRINEAIAFMALSVFALYMWFNFLAPQKPSYEIHIITLFVAIAAAASSIIARVIVDAKGTFIRTLISYLLLAATVALLLYDTSGISSPYIFMWTLVAAFAGLFGVWSSAPIFLVACGYLAVLLVGGSVDQVDIAPTVLIVIMPIIFSIIVWSHVNQMSYLRKERDPTAYKQLSDELSDLADNESSEVVINAIGDGVLAIDSQGIIQLINPAALSILGWAKGDALTLHYQSVLKLTGEDAKQLTDTMEPIKQALNTTQEIRSNHLQAETKSGKKISISLVVSPLGATGSGVIAVFRDVTKERAEEREQAEFISTASHEMRTPVASIEGYLGLALNPATATIDDKARDFINKAHESAQHLGRLFQDLLDVSKAEDGRLSNNPTVLDIVEFAGDVVEGLQQKATDKGLQLVFKPGPGKAEKGERRLSPVYHVNVDKDHIREIINNLTENAIKYTPSGEVSIDITGDNEHVTISVTDSGIGIPAEDLAHLFQKFYRVDNTDTREIGGTGLGLYLCRRLAETIGGRIWAESTYKKGSTFYVQIPRLDAMQAKHLLQEQADTREAAKTEETVSVNDLPATTPLAIPEPPATPAAPIAPPADIPAPMPPVPQSVSQTPTAAAPVPVTLESTAAPPVAAMPPQPVVQPTPVAAPAPQPQQPMPQPMPTGPQPIPVATPPQPATSTPLRTNIPLTSIEQNPTAYTAPRDGNINVPPRN